MYGAIIGDIIGSRFEFDRGGKTKEFELFTLDDCFTDDTVMTIAVADGLIQAGKEASIDEIHKSVITAMKKWGRKYPNAGYGGNFYKWLFFQKNPKPYGSYGNGSAMRVSSVGWFYDTLERTREVARATAEVTHNHPEGIKGADCTASVIFLSRKGMPKEEIKEYVVNEFGYDLSETLEQLRARHEHIESCQDSLPKALVSFFEGESYEDVVRNAISLGGDTDTLGAIAGSMAEAYYGIPFYIIASGKEYLNEDMMDVLNIFDTVIGRIKVENRFEGNQIIKEAIAISYEQRTEESAMAILQVLMNRMQEEGEVPAAMIDENNVFASLIEENEHFQLEEDVSLKLDLVRDMNGNEWIPLYTDEEEIHKGQTANVIMNVLIQDIVEYGRMDGVNGIVINPFGQAFEIPKNILEILLGLYEKRKI